MKIKKPNIKISPIYFSLILLGLGLILVFYLLLLPEIKNLLTINSQLASKNQELQQEKNKEVTLKQLTEDFKEKQAEIQKLRDLLPDTKGVSDFVIQLEAAGNATGVNLMLLKFPQQKAVAKSSSSTTEEGLKSPTPTLPQTQPQANTSGSGTLGTKVAGTTETDFEITALGSFSQVLAFLEKLESLSRFSEVRTFSVKLTESGLEVSLKGVLYHKS